MKSHAVIFSRGMKCDGCLADGGKEIYKLEQNVLLNRYCLAFWIFLPRIEGDIKTFRGLLPVKLQRFLCISNHVIKYIFLISRFSGCNRQTHFSMSIWNWQLEWLLDNTIERVHKIVSYIACEMMSHIEIVDIYHIHYSERMKNIVINYFHTLERSIPLQ